MKNSLMVMAPWLENCKGLPKEQLKEIYYQMIRYGIYEEEIDTKDPIVKMALGFITPQIDRMQDGYETLVAQGRKGGRPIDYDNEQIYSYASQGMSAKQIEALTGVPAKKIYDTQGWKRAKASRRIDSENSEKIPKTTWEF